MTDTTADEPMEGWAMNPNNFNPVRGGLVGPIVYKIAKKWGKP